MDSKEIYGNYGEYETIRLDALTGQHEKTIKYVHFMNLNRLFFRSIQESDR